MVKRILITGANGQLGQELKGIPFPENMELHFVDRNELDITNEHQIKEYFDSNTFQIVVNCAAYTAVDKAETEVELCYAVNEKGVANLAMACVKQDATFIQISTDFVFAGKQVKLLTETDEVQPLNVYGASKLAAEKIILALTTKYIIIRTSWLYSSFGNNFVKTILRLCNEKPSLNIIADQTGSPTYAADLALFIAHICSLTNLEKFSGVYHYSNEGVASWYDFAVAIKDMAGLQTPIFPIDTHSYPTPAQRPKYSVMNKHKVRDTFGVKIPYWRHSLEICIHKLNQ